MNFTVIVLFAKLSTSENLLACAPEPNNRSHLIKKKECAGDEVAPYSVCTLSNLFPTQFAPFKIMETREILLLGITFAVAKPSSEKLRRQ